MPPSPIDQLAIDTIRTLSMDAVQAASSGHPGAPMGLAPVAYTLWQNHLRYDPADPLWPNRDRFVLSAGHASMLLYATLHLAGVRAADGAGVLKDTLSITLDDIERFRQLGSPCAGHPEYGHAAGIETTTGPLGQGVATSVGMALAAHVLARTFNRPGFDLFGYDVYALAGDGCMMEGISAEAASLAGHLSLSNLCWIYDSNRITIEGHTDLAFTENVAARFDAYGWHVLHVADANDTDALDAALREFRAHRSGPTLVIVRSHIAFGAPTLQDSHEAHGAPLGPDEVRGAKRAYGWPEDASFRVPDGVREHMAAGLGARGGAARAEWHALLGRYAAAHPDLHDQLQRMLQGRLPEGWDAGLPEFPADSKGVASRAASGKVLNAVAAEVPWLMGGSADLAPSTKTTLTFEGAGVVTRETPGGRNVHFGVREHAMTAMMNGLALCKLRPYGSGFLIFSDYARPAIRVGALMELPVIHVFTHDSVFVGEDGPTHQPIEQVASLRAMPGLVVIRPGDANEVTDAWRTLMRLEHEPVALILSRQNLPTLDRTTMAPSDVARGAYVLLDCDGTPDVILIGTGSEVSLCVEAAGTLAGEGLAVRVVSMPSWELFDRQDVAWRDSVLPPEVRARVSVEAGTTFGWGRYVGRSGASIGIDRFGVSAPARDLYKELGLTVDKVVAAARMQVEARRQFARS